MNFPASSRFSCTSCGRSLRPAENCLLTQVDEPLIVALVSLRKKSMSRSSVTETNQFLVLDAIRSAGATTRPELAADLDLSPASISRIVRRLLAEGLVIEEPGPSDGVGRNRDVLRFNQRAGAV